MKIIKAIMWILILVILLLNVYSFVCIKVLGNEFAVINGKAALEVVSGSMEPTIKVGDLIVIDTEIKEYKVDDIITFRDTKGSFVTHRIVREAEGGFITQGDNNDSEDRGVLMSDSIVGVYCFRIKGFGILMTSLKSPVTFIIVLLIGVILCILVSTDKEGKPVDVNEEYIEFLEYKNNKTKNKNSELVLETSLDEVEEIDIKKEESSTKKAGSSRRKKPATSTTNKTTSTRKKSTNSSEAKTTTSKKKATSATKKSTDSKKVSTAKKSTTTKKTSPEKKSTEIKKSVAKKSTNPDSKSTTRKGTTTKKTSVTKKASPEKKSTTRKKTSTVKKTTTKKSTTSTRKKASSTDK